MTTKSKTTTVTIDGNTLVEALQSASEWAKEQKPNLVLQLSAYPVDDYWIVQVTYK